ncbi:hypothetical protein MUN89_19730 [Halobacillus salinarum]|uniref:Uncharacterized protein n=1 Tax=Halobacillus salinarum TaxID=2932257 RepID=A0ABY4EJ36_9BACI|nr:hypothetical protein [Halobacillus salinarum]UOQ44067.1 hypothetical protein MUN89_19730 [Halobacillus salinarum]
MNEAFEKYDFPWSQPKKVLVPLVYVNEKNTESTFQLKLDLIEAEDQAPLKGK